MATRKTWEIPVKAAQYLPLIRASADTYDVPFLVLARLLWQESRFDPNALNARSGAQGIAQFMPATAKELGINPYDPEDAIPAAARYLSMVKSYLKATEWGPVLAGYNWGMGNVKNAIAKYGSDWLAHAPRETQDYVRGITGDVGVV